MLIIIIKDEKAKQIDIESLISQLELQYNIKLDCIVHEKGILLKEISGENNGLQR